MIGVAKLGWLRHKAPPPTVTIDNVYGDDPSNQITVEWSSTNMPSGHYFTLVWTIDSGGSGGGTVNPATSAQVVTATDLGGSTYGTFTVNAYTSGDVFIVSDTWGSSIIPT